MANEMLKNPLKVNPSKFFNSFLKPGKEHLSHWGYFSPLSVNHYLVLAWGSKGKAKAMPVEKNI